MLTLETMHAVKFTPEPWLQKAWGNVARVNFVIPTTATDVRIKNIGVFDERTDFFIAMNHTDRFNYLPFQIKLWRNRQQFTATWVKGKYYNNPVMRKFMIGTNNIPTPSKGYIIVSDTQKVLGRQPSDTMYRAIRTTWDEGGDDDDLVALLTGTERSALRTVLETKRDLLGVEYHPSQRGYIDTLRFLFGEMMEQFVVLNEQAFNTGLRVIVFPEGTRSVSLQEGRTGLAQMALRMKKAIVPIGCNGCDKIYPGNSPWSKGGKVEYRVGSPLRPTEELAPFQIEESYRPFTDDALVHDAKFRGATDIVMSNIASLLDERYLVDGKTVVDGAKRFS